MDDFVRQVKQSEKKSDKKGKGKGKKKKDQDPEEDKAEAEVDEKMPDDEEDESIEAFSARLDLWVQVQLAMSRASGSKRDNYKDGLVYQTRKDLISDFLKSTILTRCRNEGCGW